LNCESPFYHYQDLFVEENQTEDYFYPNPCAPAESIPKEVPTFVHHRPIISWSNVLWNQPTRAMVPTFDSIGKASSVLLSESDVQTEVKDFDGFSSMPGVFYKEGNFPDEFKDVLFVSDFSGWVKTFHFDENEQLLRIEEFMDRDTGIVDLEMNPKDNCMYYVHYNTHSINKICYGGAIPPIASFRIDQQYGRSPLTIAFDASTSYDPSDLELSYLWNFGNGKTSDEPNPTHTFLSETDSPTTYEVSLTITNSEGLSDVKTITVSLNNTPPSVKITSPTNGSYYGSQDLNYLQLQADVQDAEHSKEDLSYNWQIFFHHNTHYHEEPPKQETSPFVIIEPTDCGTSEVFWHRFRLEVTDANGLMSFDELEIYPFCEASFFNVVNVAAAGSPESIMVHWEVTEAAEVVAYEIQRTKDFRFQTVGAIDANGLGTYEFEDVTPIDGRNFYRIKVIRSDGAFDYSNQVSLNFPAEPEVISVYPNPSTNGRLTVFTKYPISEELTIKIFDPIGRLLHQASWRAELGEPIENQINLSFLGNGVYFYQVENGGQIVEGRWMMME